MFDIVTFSHLLTKSATLPLCSDMQNQTVVKTCSDMWKEVNHNYYQLFCVHGFAFITLILFQQQIASRIRKGPISGRGEEASCTILH